MYKWFLIEEVNGDIFETELDEAGTREEAISDAMEIWNDLSKHDQQRRTAFYIMNAETEADGVPVQENAVDFVDLEEMKTISELVGRTYEDPEGIWEITEVKDNMVSIVNVQDGNINKGFESYVPIEEALYFLGEGGEDDDE